MKNVQYVLAKTSSSLCLYIYFFFFQAGSFIWISRGRESVSSLYLPLFYVGGHSSIGGTGTITENQFNGFMLKTTGQKIKPSFRCCFCLFFVLRSAAAQ